MAAAPRGATPAHGPRVPRCATSAPGPPTPTAYLEKDWSAEEFTRGCYGAHFAPGVWTSFGEALREPVGRIHWAGTECAVEWNGYMEGAVRSGAVAAREVLAAT